MVPSCCAAFWPAMVTDTTPSFEMLIEVASAGIVMAGSSDGGAHLASFTGADYSTRLLAEWVPDDDATCVTRLQDA